MAGPKEVQQAQTKMKHGKGNEAAWKKCQPIHKEDKGWIEEGKAHVQAKPSPGRKQDTKNEDPVTHPRHKRLRMSGRTGNKVQTSPQAMANA